MSPHDADANVMSDEQFRMFIRAYQLESGRRLLITRKGLGDEAIYFYAEQYALVRLTPQANRQLVSARGELLTFHAANLQLRDAQSNGDFGREAQDYREEQVTFAGSEPHTLAGSLLIPHGDDPHPAVILYHLANVHERDYYRLYADHFARNGIAALIYDKRGHGDSTGEALGSQIYPLIEDADAAFRFLQSHPQIDPQRIGVWGMSNGGWVDLGVAARHPDATFVMNLSASGVPPSHQEQIRRVNVSRLVGASPNQLAFLDTFWQLLFAFLIHSEWTPELETALARIQQEPVWRVLLADTGGAWVLDVPIAEIKREYGSAWQDGGFDPAPYYAQLKCPVLCLWGEDDTVLPVAESIDQIQAALQASQHPDWTVRTYPNATHLLYLNRANVDEQTNEAMHDQMQDVHFPAGLFDYLTAWAKQRLRLP
ncbi:MAG: alpha/beta fold hydrolase [Anaerolineae bacterium]|nr:alpha/beta fold hydrolase [Anaerolineae bacterium]